MKRIFAIVLVLALALAALAACSPEGPGVDGEVGMVRPGEDSSLQDYPNYQYGDIIENDFVSAAEEQSSYFSLDRNTASYSLMRRQIEDRKSVV